MYESEWQNEPSGWYPGDDEPVSLEDEAADAPIGETFAVVWRDGTVSAKGGSWVSESYDMADCDYMDAVKEVLAADENGRLVPVTLGKQQKTVTDDETPFRYATAPIMAGTRQVGTVTFTDH